MKKQRIISACGNDCSMCPRYNAPHYEKTEEQLHETAVLWHKIGYRDHVVSNKEIECTGCKVDNWCRYNVIQCTTEKGISNCGQCKLYPCSNIEECFRVTSSFIDNCKKECTPQEYEILQKAFFEKKQNLDIQRNLQK